MSRKVRTCSSSAFNTGKSSCPIPYGKVKEIILAPVDFVLDDDITGAELLTACHADMPNRIFPIVGIVEYAGDGGDANVSAVGYGPNEYNGLNPYTDQCTVGKYDAGLVANLIKAANSPLAAFLVDEDNVIHGKRDGEGNFKGYPMASVYPSAVPHATSGSKATLVVNLAHEDVEDDWLNYDFIQLDYNPANYLVGLVEVTLESAGTGKYKVVEKVGGLDVTANFGPALAEGASTCLPGASSVSYNSADETISASGTVSLAKPSVLHTAGVDGIVQG